MRFLFIVLSTIWLMFGWVSFDAMRYRPPMPPPWNAANLLEKYTPSQIDNDIDLYTYVLRDTSFSHEQMANLHYNLAQAYWLKTYLQPSRTEQNALLKAALSECFSALKYAPNSPHLVYAIADLYHQLKDFDKAETYYRKALMLNDNAHVNRRYQEMIREKHLASNS